MTTTTTTTADPRLKVLDGIELHGSPNISTDTMAAQIRYAIRQGLPQIAPEPEKSDRIALVGGGPSLTQTIAELRDVIFEGAICVTLNGSYHWAIAHNIQPRFQIVMDGRPSTARFLEPVIPRCRYLVASQCHPDVFAAVQGRPDVYLFHAVTNDGVHSPILDAYYGKGHWLAVVGGTTIATRAIALLRAGGYLRFDLFGIDSCWLDDQHHAFAQPENEADPRTPVTAAPSGYPELAKTFTCAPWHMKQLEDFLQVMRVNGRQFQLAVHGDGLIAHALHSLAIAGDVDLST